MMLSVIGKLQKQIRETYRAASVKAREAVEAALRCGQLLIAAKAAVPDGEWEKFLAVVEIPKTTAWRFMRVSQDAAKNSKRVKYLLDQGASLVDLYREFDLVKPLEGGGYRAAAYQKRKALGQIEFDFSFEECSEQLSALASARNVADLGESSLVKLSKDLDAAKRRVVSVLADKRAVDLDPGAFLEGPSEISNPKSPIPKGLRP